MDIKKERKKPENVQQNKKEAYERKCGANTCIQLL